MKIIAVAAFALGLAGCAGLTERVTALTGLTAEEQICAANAFAAAQNDPDAADLSYRQKAALVAGVCGIDLNRLLAGTAEA